LMSSGWPFGNRVRIPRRFAAAMALDLQLVLARRSSPVSVSADPSLSKANHGTEKSALPKLIR
jgi:hypothetical protein